jgi:hypothetical protein
MVSYLHIFFFVAKAFGLNFVKHNHGARWAMTVFCSRIVQSQVFAHDMPKVMRRPSDARSTV